MKRYQDIGKPVRPSFLKATVASMAAIPLVLSQTAYADWATAGVDNDWFLGSPLVGDSATADSSPLAALDVLAGRDATISVGASWTGIELENSLIIAFEDYATLALGGDLSATTDYQSLEDAFLSGAVGFFNGGVLTGDGNITITSSSATSVAPLVLAGVYSNDIGGAVDPDDAIESIEPPLVNADAGTLDITGFTGDITVTNDNSVGSALVTGEGSIPLPIIGGLDLSKSAVAVGLAAVESDDGIDLGLVEGDVTQTITTTAKSRNAESFDLLEILDDEPGIGEPAVTVAAAVGVVGELEDGIASSAVIETTATSGSAVAQTESDAIAVNLGLSVGVGGIVDDIESGATITTSATSSSSSATSGDNDAYSNNVALAAGVIGVVGDEDEIPDGDEPPAATTTITTTATSAVAAATADELAQAASGALAVGVGGLIEDLSDSSLTTTATSGAVTTDGDLSLALSLTGAIGAITLDQTGMDTTTLASTATSGTADADAEDSANASALSVAGGAIGSVAPESADLSLNVAANAGASTASSSGYSAADATALAFGVSSGEVLLALGESIGPIIDGLGDLGGIGDVMGGIMGGLGSVPLIDPLALGGEPAPIEGDPVEATPLGSIVVNGTVAATAADATATNEFELVLDEPEADLPISTDAYASAAAIAVGVDSQLGLGSVRRDVIEGDGLPASNTVTGALTVTATAGTATASGNVGGDSLASAFAQGLGEVNADYDGTLDVTADAGTAASTFGTGLGGLPSTEADATARAVGIDELNGNLIETANITVNANGGTSSVAFDPGDQLVQIIDGFGTGYADSSSRATGIAEIQSGLFKDPADSIEGNDVSLADVSIDGSVVVSATSISATVTDVSDASSNAGSVAIGIGTAGAFGSTSADFESVIDVDAAGGDAMASGGFNADAQADTYATGLITGDTHFGNIGGSIEADAIGGSADASSRESASASANTEAVGVYSESDLLLLEGDDYLSAGGDIIGSVSASINVNAVSDSATATSNGGLLANDAIEGFDIGDTLVIAQAEALAIGIEGVNTISGSVDGPITGSAVGGYASAEANEGGLLYSDAIEGNEVLVQNSPFDYEVVAIATSEAVGIEGTVDGVLDSTIDLTAGGGRPGPVAVATNNVGGIAIADARAITIGVTGDVLGNEFIEFDEESEPALDGSFTQSASGGIAAASVSEFDDIIIWPVSGNEPDPIEAGPVDNGPIEPIYTVSADASAESTGVNGSVSGDVEADFTIDATGGEALASSDGELDSRRALAYADAAGIYGTVSGNFDGTMQITATGGDAFLEDSGLLIGNIDADGYDSLSGSFADASAIATGIGGGNPSAIEGDIAGSISATATGGRVAAINMGDGFIFLDQGIRGLSQDPVVDLEPSDELAVREATYNAYAQAVAVNGDVLAETVSADIAATATGGTVAFQSDILLVEDEPTEVQVFTKQQVIGPDYSVAAFAAGIAGQGIVIDEVTGDITATATAGSIIASSFGYTGLIDSIEAEDSAPLPPEFPPFPVGRPSEAGFAFAAGIMTYTPASSLLYTDAIEGEPPLGGSLDVTISSNVTAIADGGFGLILDDPISQERGRPIQSLNAYAAAVYGAMGDDAVQLADGANIVGDINLGGGLNTLTVLGNSIMEGNILSSANSGVDFILNISNGLGTVDFDISEGFFTAVRTVFVSDLEEVLLVDSQGGIAPILVQNDEDFDNSLIDVNISQLSKSAAVELASGSTVLPVFDESVDLNSVVGNEYRIVSAEDGITDNGALVDNSETPFDYILEIRDNIPADAIEGVESIEIGGGQDLFLVVDGAKKQDEEETPGTVQTNQAVNSSSQAVLVDISKHAALLRTLLRSSSQGSAPEGPSGPDAEKMKKGEWLSYVSVFGNLGRQDSSNGFAGFEYDTYGFVFGQEKLFGDQLILGLAGGYAETDIDGLDSSGGGDSDLYSLVVYANWFTDTWYTEAGLTFGHAESDVRRVDFKNDVYTGDYDSDLFGGWLEVGFTTEYEGFGVEPYARATYVHGDHEGFTDEGPDALVLTTDDTETDNFKTELGIRVNEEWLFENNRSILVEVKAGWQHEWGDEGVTVDASYLGDDTLTLDSAEADEDAIVLGIRGEWSNGKGLSIGLEYEPTFSGNWYNHAFSGTLQYNW